MLGREPTPMEEAFAIFLVRTGRRFEVERVIRGERADGGDAIRATYDVADLIVEHWESLDPRHQEAIRSELRRLLWRIGGRALAGSWQEASAAIMRADLPELENRLGEATPP